MAKVYQIACADNKELNENETLLLLVKDEHDEEFNKRISCSPVTDQKIKELCSQFFHYNNELYCFNYGGKEEEDYDYITGSSFDSDNQGQVVIYTGVYRYYPYE